MVDLDKTVERVSTAGLCMQCGTCVGLCPRGSVTQTWDARAGLRLRVDPATCNECGICLEACPGEGLDFGPDAWWRERNGGAPWADFLGPWRSLHFGWAADEAVRFRGASGGVATALLQGALATGAIDAALVVGMGGSVAAVPTPGVEGRDRASAAAAAATSGGTTVDPLAANPLAAVPLVARTAEEIAACRGSKYTPVGVNRLLRTVLDEPGRYALIGLPCHIQGLRLAQRRSRRLRERVVLAIGIFCGLTALPRAAEIAARRAGVDPADVAGMSYRGPDWPGGLRLVTGSGETRYVPYPDYWDRWVDVWVPPRCRLCPDALAELADISIGDTWLDRFEGCPGISDLIVRTEAGAELVERLGSEWLTLEEARPGETVQSQRETEHIKRDIYRGRMWLWDRLGRPVPSYPGVSAAASWRERLDGTRDAAREWVLRLLGDLRYP